MKYKVCLSTKVNYKTLSKGSGILVLEPDDYTASVIQQIKKKGVYIFLLEYTKDDTVKKQIEKWCKDNGASYYISSNVNL